LAVQGHGYFSLVVPAVIAMLVLAVAAFVARLATVDRRRDHHLEPGRAWRLWAGASALLVLIHFSQETIEGLLSSGHPPGLGGGVGNGGWIAALLSVAIGGLIALLLRGAAAIEHAAAKVPHPHRGPSRPRAGVPAHDPRLPIDPVARHLAGRGPPLACS
jgi:hypothetical protein